VSLWDEAVVCEGCHFEEQRAEDDYQANHLELIGGQS
jgi:hypothetical protein